MSRATRRHKVRRRAHQRRAKVRRRAHQRRAKVRRRAHQRRAKPTSSGSSVAPAASSR